MVMIAPQRTKPSSIPELQERCMDMFTNVSVSSSDALQSQNEFLNEYLTWQHSILIQILKHESLPANPDCANCHQSSSTHRCQDCFGRNLWCGPCCVSVHKNVPFHCVQMWNDNFFEQSDLLTHEMELSLCHHPGDCSSDLHTLDVEVMSDLDISDDGDGPLDEHGWQESFEQGTHSQSQSNLIIVTSTSIFKHSVRWCHCANSSDKYVQLLHARLFPASFKNLQTAFTFEVLDHFQVDALEFYVQDPTDI